MILFYYYINIAQGLGSIAKKEPLQRAALYLRTLLLSLDAAFIYFLLHSDLIRCRIFALVVCCAISVSALFTLIPHMFARVSTDPVPSFYFLSKYKEIGLELCIY